MVDGRHVTGFFGRAFSWFGAFAQAMEETEVSALERRVARLEREFAAERPATAPKPGRVGDNLSS